MLEMPNWHSLQRTVFSSRWFHLDLPRHHVHFTSHSLLQCLAAAGFTDIGVTSIPSPVGIMGSLQVILRQNQTDAAARPWRHNRVLKAASWLPEALFSRVGLGGCLMATARKP
jgi:hypothetical protein